MSAIKLVLKNIKSFVGSLWLYGQTFHEKLNHESITIWKRSVFWLMSLLELINHWRWVNEASWFENPLRQDSSSHNLISNVKVLLGRLHHKLMIWLLILLLWYELIIGNNIMLLKMLSLNIWHWNIGLSIMYVYLDSQIPGNIDKVHMHIITRFKI